MKTPNEIIKDHFSGLSRNEKVVAELLNKHHIYYHYGCTPDFLNGLHLDFYIPSLNLGIEYDGYQHFHPCNYGGRMDDEAFHSYHILRLHDKKKNKLCKSRMTLLRIENYTQANLDTNYISSLLFKGIDYSKDHNGIIYEPKPIKPFIIHTKEINDAKPLPHVLVNKIIHTLLKLPNGLQNVAIFRTMEILRLHSRDILRFRYDDVFSDNGIVNIIATKEKDQKIGLTRHNFDIPPLLRNVLSKYESWIRQHNIHSSWLFPNIHNPSKHVSFDDYSRIINKVANILSISHFNTYSIRKTGARHYTDNCDGYNYWDQASGAYYYMNDDRFLKYVGYSEASIDEKIHQMLKYMNRNN